MPEFFRIDLTQFLIVARKGDQRTLERFSV